MGRLWIVLVWLFAFCLLSQAALPSHHHTGASPKVVAHDKPEDSSSPIHHRVDNTASGVSEPHASLHHTQEVSETVPAHSSLSTTPYAGSRVTSAYKAATTDSVDTPLSSVSLNPSDWNKSRSGYRLHPDAPTVDQILQEFKSFWSGKRKTVRQSLLFWVGRQQVLYRSNGRPTNYVFALDSNLDQAQDFANYLSEHRPVKIFTLQNLRGDFAKTWTDYRLDWDEQGAMFDRLSAAMALLAEREVRVYGSPEAFARTGTAWSEIEYPILKARGIKIIWYTVDGSEHESQPPFMGPVFVAPPKPPGKGPPHPWVHRPFIGYQRSPWRQSPTETGKLRPEPFNVPIASWQAAQTENQPGAQFQNTPVAKRPRPISPSLDEPAPKRPRSQSPSHDGTASGTSRPAERSANELHSPRAPPQNAGSAMRARQETIPRTVPAGQNADRGSNPVPVDRNLEDYELEEYGADVHLLARELDDAYYKLIFSGLDMADDPLYESSELPILMGSLGISLPELFV